MSAQLSNTTAAGRKALVMQGMQASIVDFHGILTRGSEIGGIQQKNSAPLIFPVERCW